MKKIFVLLSLILVCYISNAQSKDTLAVKPNPSIKTQLVEAACGQCKFGLEGKACDLAVRIDGKAYFVDGTKIDDHGDAHAEDGFCNAIRKAEVQGAVVDGRFKATYFKVKNWLR